MKDPFKNPLSPKERKTSVNFAAPSKEQATTGRWMNAGDNYGVGFRNPIGKSSVSNKGAIPMESKCVDPNSMA